MKAIPIIVIGNITNNTSASSKLYMVSPKKYASILGKIRMHILNMVGNIT